MDNPEVSIITPAYNAERFIEQAVESVRAQTLKNWELLVVIDGNSRDNTERISRSLAAHDARIKVLAEATRGVAANRNLGIEIARSRYICLLDSDDWWHPEKIERQLTLMRETRASFSFTSYFRMSEDAKRCRSIVRAKPIVTYRELLKNNNIGCLTVMINKWKYNNLQFRQENHEDYALWLRLLRPDGAAYGLDEPLAYYRQVTGSRSDDKIRAACWRLAIYRRQERLSWAATIRYFVHYAASSVLHRGSRSNCECIHAHRSDT